MAGKKLTDKEIKQVLAFIEKKKQVIEAMGLKITGAVSKAKDAVQIENIKAQMSNLK